MDTQNDNGLFRYNERTLRTISEEPISNYHYDIETDLTGIVSVECVLKCLKINNGYAVGDIIPTTLTPTLSNNHIILNTQDIYIHSKFESTSSLINSNEWELIFRLKR